MSPLGAMDAGQLRRLARVLRKRDREAAGGQRLPRSSDELLREALMNPLLLDEEASPAEARFVALGERLLKARNIVTAGAAPDEVMWSLWSDSPWLRRLRGQAHSGGETARAANRDLDSLCALFDAASRAEEQVGFKGVSAFLSELESLDIAADNRFDGTYREAGVQLMTAHRSKGLQWRLVVVASVQEGQWPDLRRRGSLLEPDRLGPDGLVDPLSAGALLAEERRSVLRRDHASPGAVDRDSGAGAGGGRRSAVQIACRARHSFETGCGTAAAAVVVARSGRRSAVCARGSRVVARVEAGRG